MKRKKTLSVSLRADSTVSIVIFHHIVPFYQAADIFWGYGVLNQIAFRQLILSKSSEAI